MATALAHPAGALRGQGATVASSGRLGPWCDRCIAWEVAASQGRGAGGWRAVAADQGRGVARPTGARPTTAAIGRWQNQVQKC
jgi:hypothetical protein